MGEGKEEENEEEIQENIEENQEELLLDQIGDEKKFTKNTSEENLKHKQETKKNIRNIVNEREEKVDTSNISHNSSVSSQSK